VLVLLASPEPLSMIGGASPRADGAWIDAMAAPSPGEPVVLLARWYKPISAEARDRRVRTYPAFVGRWISGSPAPVATSARAGGERMEVLPLAAMLVALVCLLIVVIIVARLLGRRSRPRLASPIPAESAMMDGPDLQDLPEDPAEALAVLHQRHSS
jgi:hypothetical protein